jgi:hypothetical protein
MGAVKLALAEAEIAGDIGSDLDKAGNELESQTHQSYLGACQTEQDKGCFNLTG